MKKLGQLFTPADSKRGRQFTAAKGSRIVTGICAQCNYSNGAHRTGCPRIEIELHNAAIEAKRAARKSRANITISS